MKYGVILCAVLEDCNKMRELEWSALQQACAVISMSIFKQRTYEEIERRRKNDFIFTLFNRRERTDLESSNGNQGPPVQAACRYVLFFCLNWR